jgi:hypothetical protein
MSTILRVSILLLVLILLPMELSRAQVPPSDPNFSLAGRGAFQFLRVGASARHAALGEAAIAVTSDVNSVFWNPAGITGIERGELSFSYARWLADLDYVGAAAGLRLGRIGYVGVHIAAMGYGDIQETIVIEGGIDPRTGQTFSGSSLLFGMTYARQFTDRLSIGVTAKRMREQLWEFTAGKWAFDAGTSYDIGFNGMRLAMSAQHYARGGASWLEPDSDSGSRGHDIPLVFRVGLASSLIGPGTVFDIGPLHHLMMSLESVNTNDLGERFHVGAEYTFANFLMLRGGYKFGHDDGSASLGFGLHTGLGGTALRFDYAYVNYEFLNSPHRLTLTMGY